MGITWDEILIAVIIIISITVWCWFKTKYHIESNVDMTKPFWWL